MKEFTILSYVLKELWKMVKHRKAWLRMNRIDYSTGACSERTYRFGNFMINAACVFFIDFWIMLSMFIIGAIFFF